MNEIDVLKKISSNLTERKNSAALSNYRVLCSNIAFLNDAFLDAISTLRLIHGEIESSLKNDSILTPQFKSGTDLNAFIPIVSRLQLNSFSVFEKLAALTTPDDRAHITIENVSALSRGFDDYNGLVTATRQYIAGLIGSLTSVPLTCMCGETKTWAPPHATTELYCDSCGSSFQLLEVGGDGGYKITSNGPVKIIGANVPDFRDLPMAEQIKLLQQCEEAKKAHGPQPGRQPDAAR